MFVRASNRCMTMMQVSILVQVLREGLPAFFKGLPGLWVLKKTDDCIACHLLDIEVSHQNLAAKKPTDHLNNSNILGVCVCVSLCHCVTLSHAVPLAHCRHVMQKKKRNSRPTRGTSNSAAGLAYLSHAASLVSLCRSVCLKVWEQRNCY